MIKNRSIQKSNRNVSISKLEENLALAERGIQDLETAQRLHELKEEMFEQFKAENYGRCAKICRKIISINDNIPIVHLLYKTSQSRMKKKRL